MHFLPINVPSLSTDPIPHDRAEVLYTGLLSCFITDRVPGIFCFKTSGRAFSYPNEVKELLLLYYK